MTNEFKKLSGKSETRYILEDSATVTTGAIATVEKPLGELQRRAEPQKPRNFVAKNAKMGGAGAHKDKKKAEKQGNVKHKNREMDMAEAGSPAQQAAIAINMKKHHQKPKGVAEGAVKELSADLKSMLEKDFVAKYKKTKAEARSAMKTVSEGGYSHGFADPLAPGLGRRFRDRDSGDDEPQGMFMVMIDGRPWKEFTSNMAFQRAKSIATKYPDKKVQVKWPTGQLNTVAEQGVAEGIKGAIAGGAAGALLTRTPSGAMTGADIGNTLGDMTDENYDEAETMKNSLHTIIRMATELDKHIDDSSEFDEWVSEKMGAVKGMLTAVTDYVISDQEMGSHEEETDEEIAPGIVHQHQHGTLKHTSTAMEGAKVDRQAKHITKSMMKSHPGMSKDNAESAAWAHIKHPKKKKKVKEDAYNIYLEVLLNKSLNK